MHSAWYLVHTECLINSGSKPVTPVAFIMRPLISIFTQTKPKMTYVQTKEHTCEIGHKLISSWMT